MKLHPAVAALEAHCGMIRWQLHQIPEVGFEEHETQAYIFRLLAPLKPDVLETVATTGVRAVFYAEAPRSTIALRADIDGLYTTEQNETDYVSQHTGRMHACGHDGHTAMLLTLAELIASDRAALRHNVVLLFQPAEEGQNGARYMIEGGALDNPKVDRIYGIHLWPAIDKGKIGVRWGPMMAQTLEFDVIVHGKSAHGASPQLGVDAIVAAAEMITFTQSIITRNVDPHQDVLLTFGKINGGVARNIIADRVELNGTLRAFNSAVFEDLERRMHAALSGLETVTGARFEFRYNMHYPCVDNPRPLVEEFYRLVGMEDTVVADPVMAAEDFACYQEAVPGMFVFLGVRGGKNDQPLHSSRFDFDEDVLLSGVEIYRRLLSFSPGGETKQECDAKR